MASTPIKAAPAPVSTPKRSGRQYQDVNHLLGFTLPPRAPPPPPGPRRSAKRAPGYAGSYDKERYVQSTFRFMVKPTADYTAHFADADKRLNWDDEIVQVIVDTTSALANVSTASMDQPVETNRHQVSIPTCPICLSEPTAARMTKCGHVYCLPCILHYLALADGTKWRKCPVCHDSIYAKDLRPVKWHDPVASSALVPLPTSSDPLSTSPPTSSTLSPSEPLKMRLIRRPQITSLAFPRSTTWPSEATPPLRAPWDFTPDAPAFAKFMLASPDYLKAELDGDLRELERELDTLLRWGAGGEGEMGVLFVQAAVDKVNEERARTQDLKTQWVMTARKRACRELVEIATRVGNAGLHLEVGVGAETSSSEVEDDFPESLGGGGAGSRRTSELSSSAPVFIPPGPPGSAPASTKARPARKNVNPPTPPDQNSAFFFYQAASGQRIFLHPLDIRILKSHFGTYEGMPDTIEVAVDGFDEGSMNDELRRRCRWLAHLPTAADVVFIEADLSKVVSRESLEPFANALRMRRNKRKDKAKRDDKAKAKSEQKELDERPPPVYGSFDFPPDASFFPPPSSYANPTTAFEEPHSFPPPATSRPPAPANSSPPTTGPATVWGTRSFASSARAGHHDEADDDLDFDERWSNFEEGLRGNNARRPSASPASASTGANSGGGAVPASRVIVAGGGGGRRKKKLVLSLTAGAGGRGTG